MKLVAPREALVLLSSVLLTACLSTKPARWTIGFEEEVRCGMSVEEVEGITGKKVDQNVIVSDERGTHHIGTDTTRTNIVLSFDDNKLQWYRIYKIYRLKAVKSYPTVQLCKK